MDEVESLTLPAAAEYRLETPHQSPSATASPQGEAFEPVSYTHLDVYKRQALTGPRREPVRLFGGFPSSVVPNLIKIPSKFLEYYITILVHTQYTACPNKDATT